MTREEAESIARIVGTADSGCSSCVRGLCEKLNAEKFGWTFTMDPKEVEMDWPNGDCGLLVNVVATMATPDGTQKGKDS